jgi:hypothetical protein
MRSDAVFDSIGELVRTRQESVSEMQHAWGDSREDVERVHEVVRQLLYACAGRISGKPRVKAETVQGIIHPDLIALQRVGWIVSYWTGIERTGDLTDFGFPPSSSMP